ncbi:MAG: SGNH/GDSL hydrolase family protein [Myxococcota bacterium]
MIALFLAACTPSTPADTDTYDPTAPLRERCFGELGEGALIPSYDGFGPTVPRHCMGTNHQDIDAVGKVVFLGDSITAGTPPTPVDEVYRNLLGVELAERFGSLELDNCSEWGARLDDLVGEGKQIESCFPEVQTEPVLVVMTVGGNDMVAWGGDLAGGTPVEEVTADFEAGIAYLESALTWFKDDPDGRFPAGVNVVFANVYEYTDGTNEVGVCPLADLFDVPEDISEFGEGYVNLNEAYMELAVRTQTDMVFLYESFCGHGFFHDDPNNPCYRGPEAERWFDDTCIHPNPTGHRVLADMVLAVVDE